MVKIDILDIIEGLYNVENSNIFIENYLKNEKKTVLAKALTSVADGMLSKAANSRCALIYHQPKQPEEVRKFRKNK